MFKDQVFKNFFYDLSETRAQTFKTILKIYNRSFFVYLIIKNLTIKRSKFKKLVAIKLIFRLTWLDNLLQFNLKI